MYRSVISLSKIAYQMWRDHPFSQRNMTAEKNNGGGGGGGVDKIENRWGYLENNSISTLCQLCKEIKNFPSPHYKTNPPPFLASPLFLVKIFHSSHSSHFEKFHSNKSGMPFYRRFMECTIMKFMKRCWFQRL